MLQHLLQHNIMPHRFSELSSAPNATATFPTELSEANEQFVDVCVCLCLCVRACACVVCVRALLCARHGERTSSMCLTLWSIVM
jgi:hypothetical protein